MLKILNENDNKIKFQKLLDEHNIKFPFYVIAVDEHHPIDRKLHWYTKLFRQNNEEFIGTTNFEENYDEIKQKFVNYANSINELFK